MGANNEKRDFASPGQILSFKSCPIVSSSLEESFVSLPKIAEKHGSEC